MKKLFILAVSVFATYNIAMADDKPIDFNNLPQAAKTLVTQHFADKKIAGTTIDKELMSTEYKIYFSDGCKVEFNGDGQWKDIDCKGSAIPSGLIPEKIAKYLNTTYPGATVSEMEKDRMGYDIKISNGMELKFNKSQKFLRLDY